MVDDPCGYLPVLTQRITADLGVRATRHRRAGPSAARCWSSAPRVSAARGVPWKSAALRAATLSDRRWALRLSVADPSEQTGDAWHDQTGGARSRRWLTQRIESRWKAGSLASLPVGSSIEDPARAVRTSWRRVVATEPGRLADVEGRQCSLIAATRFPRGASATRSRWLGSNARLVTSAGSVSWS